MPTFTSPFTGDVINPTDVSYYELTFSSDQDLYWPAVVNPEQVPLARIMDCTALQTGLHINLPQGNQGSVGTDVLIRNLGSFVFSVVNFGGLSSVFINPGESKWFYLSDNSTPDGVWQNVTFGTGTSTADAASLQGPGLTTLSGKLAVTQNIIEVSSPPTITNVNRASTYVWTAGATTFYLPSSATLTAGWFIAIRNNGTGTLTIEPSAPSLLNGFTTIDFNPGDSGFVIFQQSTGDFFTVGFTPPPNVTFTSATYDVDSIVGSTFSLVSFAPVIQSYISVSGFRTTSLAVTLPAITQIYILANDTGATSYNLTFQVSGSSQPPTIVPAGTILTCLSDGSAIYPLTSTTTGGFYAIDGSAALPSYSFSNDNNTGLFLAGTSVMGITTNSTEIMNFDGTNLLYPVVTTPAEFIAGLIRGGTF